MGEKWNKLVARAQQARKDHDGRHTPSGFDFATAHYLDYLNAADWDAATRDASVFMSRRYLQILDECRTETFQPRYALVYRGRSPVAAVAMQWIEIHGTDLVQLDRAAAEDGPRVRRILRNALKKVGERALASMTIRALVCGNVYSWGHHGVACGPGVSTEEAWAGAVEALYRVRRAEKLSGDTDYLLIRDVPGPGEEEARVLKKFSYRALNSDPDMVLDLDAQWKTYDDYLSGLNKKYRKAAKAMDKKLEQAGIELEAGADLSTCGEACYALYRQLYEKAATRLQVLLPDYLPRLASTLGGDFRCTLARRGEKIIGFVTTVKDGDTAVGYYIGYDHAANADAPVYLRLLYATIGDALALGCYKLSLGRTALEPKSRMGCKPKPMGVWVRHRHPLLNLFSHHLQRVIPHDEAPDRNPFK